MIFVFGLALLIIGIPLGLYKEEVTTYSYYSMSYIGNIKVPTGVKDVYPFQQLAVLLMFAGLILIISGIYLAKKDNSTDKALPEEIKRNAIMESSQGVNQSKTRTLSWFSPFGSTWEA